MFKAEMTGIGVASIIGMFCLGFGYILTLIYGWKHKEAWALQKIMPIYTICFILGLILYGAGYAILLPKLIEEQRQLIEQGAGGL